MDAHTDKNYMMRWVGINPSTHIGVNNMDENKVWTDEDIGEEVEITIEGMAECRPLWTIRECTLKPRHS